jgi:hypothetical protein
MARLVQLFEVEDEDGIPIPFDFLELLDSDAEEREEKLTEKLADCPNGELTDNRTTCEVAPTCRSGRGSGGEAAPLLSCDIT